MNAKLKKRAQAVIAYVNLNKRPTEAEISEVAAVHHLLTGKTTDCNGCNFYGFINQIETILFQQPINLKNMANAHFKPEHAGTTVIRHDKNTVISSTNLSEGDNLAWIGKHYPHLLAGDKTAAKTEAAPAPEKEDAPATTTTTTTATKPATTSKTPAVKK